MVFGLQDLTLIVRVEHADLWLDRGAGRADRIDDKLGMLGCHTELLGSKDDDCIVDAVDLLDLFLHLGRTMGAAQILHLINDALALCADIELARGSGRMIVMMVVIMAAAGAFLAMFVVMVMLMLVMIVIVAAAGAFLAVFMVMVMLVLMAMTLFFVVVLMFMTMALFLVVVLMFMTMALFLVVVLVLMAMALFFVMVLVRFFCISRCRLRSGSDIGQRSGNFVQLLQRFFQFLQRIHSIPPLNI